MKKFILSLLLFSSLAAGAQKDLMIRKGDKGLYLEHKVEPKQSYFSIGRLYHIQPKELASYNKLDIAKGLQIDQKLRIPLSDSNFVQDRRSGTAIFYRAGENEGLSVISNKFNNVSAQNLKDWNGLAGDDIKKDNKLIIGFLSNEGSRPVGSAIKTASSITNNEEGIQAKAEEKTVAEPPLTKEEKKQEEKQAEAELKGEKKDEKKDPVPLVKETRKPVIEGQGYFKNHFDQQIKKSPLSKDATVTAGIFKTLSGWQDAKYYLLIDAVQPGTIVRVINPTNNKAIYAKVLGEMSGIRQNEGLNIRISNAAASALEVTEQDKFIVKVNY